MGEDSDVPYQSRIFLRSFANSFYVAVMAGAYAA